MTDPIAPPPVRPPTKPAARKRTPQPAAPAPSAAVAVPVAVPVEAKSEQASESLLASMFASKPAAETRTQPYARSQVSATAMAALMGIRQVDPEKDLVNTGIRFPKYVVAAARLMAGMTAQPLQKVLTAAATGAEPLPPDVLDAAFLELYGYQRPDNG